MNQLNFQNTNAPTALKNINKTQKSLTNPIKNNFKRKKNYGPH